MGSRKAVALALVALSVAITGCATDDPATLRALDSDRKALQLRLDRMQRAGAKDLILRDARRAAAERARSLSPEDLRSGAAYMVVKDTYFQAMLDALTPLRFQTGGYRWALGSGRVEIVPDGIRVLLGFKVDSKSIRRKLKRPARGRLTGHLLLRRAEDGAFVVRFSALDYSFEDSDFRVGRVVKDAVAIEEFDGVVPEFGIPIAPADQVTCCGRTIGLTVEFDPDSWVPLQRGVVIPISMTVGQVEAVTPEEPPAPAPDPAAEQSGVKPTHLIYRKSTLRYRHMGSDLPS